MPIRFIVTTGPQIRIPGPESGSPDGSAPQGLLPEERRDAAGQACQPGAPAIPNTGLEAGETMPAQVRLITKVGIRYKGQLYANREDLPAEAREAFDRAVASALAAVRSGQAGGGQAGGGQAGSATELIFNGQAYDSVEAMPPEARRVYEGIMATIDRTGIPGSALPGPAQPAHLMLQLPAMAEPPAALDALPEGRPMAAAPLLAGPQTAPGEARLSREMVGRIILVLLLAGLAVLAAIGLLGLTFGR
jgi:hypothetical protein